MSRNVPVKAEPYALKNKLRRIWRQFVRVMACVVVFCTTYAMILPAITMQRKTICGVTEHTHGILCYVQLTSKTVQELTCTYESLGVHVHTAECQDGSEQTVCGYADWLVHTHDERCGDVCTLPEISAHTHSDACCNTHAHDGACYTAVPGALACQLHVHGDSCYDNGEPVCGLTEEAHVHEDACYAPALICAEAEHTHGGGCYETEQVLCCGLEEISPEDAQLVCGLEEIILHSHSDDCCDTETGVLSCGLTAVEAHSHTGPCFTTTEIPLDNMDTLTCTETDENHLHIERCYGTWAMICGTEEHTHVESCYPAEPESEYDCGLTEHTHDDSCYDAGDVLQCLLEPHSHAESGCGIAVDLDVAYVNELIENIPSADEIEAKLAEFQAAGDDEGAEAWQEEVCQNVAEAYHYYDQLSDTQKAALTDEQKLLELEYIWSVTPYAAAWTYTWKAPTLITDAAHTSDFIELNLYDYSWNINKKFWESKYTAWKLNSQSGVTSKYPGFQWNGGAYMKSTTFNRHTVDYIDFGNSLITDGWYTGSGTGITDGKNKDAVSVTVNRNASITSTELTGSFTIANMLNSIDVNNTYGVTNRPVGMSLSGNAFNTSGDVLTRIMTPAGYPALANQVDKGGSLAYLFGGEAVDYVTKKNTASIDGLFQIDETTGAYYYNSRENHAQFDAAQNKFLLYEEFLTPNFIVYPFGNFLPFNSISDSEKATYISGHSHLKGYIGGQMIASLEGSTDLSRSHLYTMLQHYRQSYIDSGQWDTITPLGAIKDFLGGGGDGPTSNMTPLEKVYNAGKIYNIDFDEPTNFFFGMDMAMTIMQPKNGLAGNDNNRDGTPDYPMVFQFTGDDDVWVYIDGILFLDLSGIHRHVGGEIDFQKGEVRYYSLDTVVTGDVQGDPYTTYQFKDIVLQAYRYKHRAGGGQPLSEADIQAKVNQLINPATGRFFDYSTHQFKFFYTERGSGSSVCRMNFNFPLLKQNSISVTKENTTLEGGQLGSNVLGNPDYYFDIMQGDNLFVGPGSVTGVSQYKIRNSDGSFVKDADGEEVLYTTDDCGIFTLKAGQTAVFENINENEGVFYVQELIRDEDNAQYPTVSINDKDSIKTTRYNKLVDWQYRKYFSNVETPDPANPMHIGPYGSKWYARSGYNTDSSSSSSFYFEQQNHVDADKLAKLAITKVLDAAKPGTAADQVFRINVELDKIPLPKGTLYTADGVQKTVTDAGVIELKAGQTAVISNILSGTKFVVYEDAASANGFFVGYERTDGGEAVVSGNTISGVIRHSTTAALKITNTDNAAGVTLDGTKSIDNADAAQGENTFTFVLTEADENGEPLTGGYTDTKMVTVADGTDAAFGFALYYRAADYPAGTEFPVIHRYRIRESSGDGFVSDGRCYIAQVAVDKDGDGKLTATLEKLFLNGSTVDSMVFVNTLVGDMTLEKIVDGGALSRENDRFDFTIQFRKDAETFLTDWNIQVDKNNTSAGTFTTDSGGCITLTGIKHGDRVELKGIPLGTVWRITESNTDGYIVDWTVNETPGSSSVSTGSVLPGGTEVVYTNHSTYVLPETGGIPIPYTMAGAMLMLFSAVCLVYSKLKRRREAV